MATLDADMPRWPSAFFRSLSSRLSSASLLCCSVMFNVTVAHSSGTLAFYDRKAALAVFSGSSTQDALLHLRRSLVENHKIMAAHVGFGNFPHTRSFIMTIVSIPGENEIFHAFHPIPMGWETLMPTDTAISSHSWFAVGCFHLK